MLITSQDDLLSFTDRAAKEDFLTVDTEFLREKTYYPKLCLIQIGLPGGDAAAIDPLAKAIDLEPVFALLRDKNILKIFHAARQDLEIFYQLMGEVPAPLFDTQIAAMVCGYGNSVGYESLVHNLTDATLDKAVQFTDWSRRPLSEKQLNYALGDVTHLVQVYHGLLAQLEKTNRTKWVFEEEKILANPDTYTNPPQDAWKRVKIKTNKPKVLATLRALAAWREERAQEKDLPRSWVMRDETLADMAAQAPKTADQLQKIRNMPKDQAHGRVGKELLALIKAVPHSDPADWPRKDKRKSLPSAAISMAELLKTQLRMVASDFEVAGKLIASNEDLEQIALYGDKAKDVPALEGWRYDIFGKHALAMGRGEIAIAMKDGAMVYYQVTPDMTAYKDS